MSDVQSTAIAVSPAHDVRGLLRVTAFRRMWISLSLSSLGDWLGLLATTALAASLSHGDYAKTNVAVSSVFILRLLPAVVLGPIAGVLADRLDRRWTMVIGDVVRCLLFVSIPLVGTLWWLFVATFLVESVTLFWIPAKEATVPNLVPRERLEAANQLSLLTTYGSAPVAAGLFALLSLANGLGGLAIKALRTNPVDLALYFDAGTYLVAALTIVTLHQIPKTRQAFRAADSQPSFLRALVEGWTFIGGTPLVRGLVVGMLGAFAAGGAVIGLARAYASDLGAGDAAYGVLFGAVFCGLATGMFVGPRLLHGFSRRRMFGLSICGAGSALAVLALIPNVVIATLVAVVIGGFAGIAWVTGYTLIGLEVSDALRGRTFAFVQSMVRVVLVLVLAVAPLIAAAVGRHHVRLPRHHELTYNGAAFTFLVAGVLAAVVGLLAFRQMDDRRGVSLWGDVVSSLRRHVPPPTGAGSGLFVAFEGGDGGGKSTQVRLLAERLRSSGYDVVTTKEPGGTPTGLRLREVLLGHATGDLAPRAEALLYAADRAEHVSTVVRPALQRGAVVLTDRYVDSSIAYQGAGRVLDADDVAMVSAWATGGLVPDLTVVLDVAPDVGAGRFDAPADRLEAEPADFHERVRRGFLDLAAQASHRYLVLDATLPPEQVAAAVLARLQPALATATVTRRPAGQSPQSAAQREHA